MKKAMLFVVLLGMNSYRLESSISTAKKGACASLAVAASAVCIIYRDSISTYLQKRHTAKIAQAYEVVKDLENKFSKMQLNDCSEQELISNLNAVGLDQKSGVRLLQMLENLQQLVKSYNSWFLALNWTENMKQATEEIESFLSKHDAYIRYLQKHKHCLVCWNMYGHYLSLMNASLTDPELLAQIATRSTGASGKYLLVDAVSRLYSEISLLKDFLLNQDCKQLYPVTYEKVKSLLLALTCAFDAILSSYEYRQQAEKRSKEHVFSSIDDLVYY